MARVGTARAVLLAAGLLLVGDLFLPWRTVCVEVGASTACGTRPGWAGIGTAVGLTAIGLLLWESLLALDVRLPAARVASAAAAAAVLSLTIAELLLHDGRRWPAWAGLALATVQTVAAFAQKKRRDPPHRSRL